MSNNKVNEIGEIKKCKRCQKPTTVGLKCVKCGTLSHRSCIKSMKNAVILDEYSANCCLVEENLQSTIPEVISCSNPRTPNSAVKEKSPFNSMDINEIRIMYLEELVKQKDATIKNQDIAIQSLQEQIMLLKRGLLSNSNQKLDINETSARAHSASSQSNSYNQKSTNKHFITTNEVSNAVHNAQTASLCNHFVNIEQEAVPKSNINSRPRNKPKTLLVGKMHMDNVYLKAAQKVSLKYFHITNFAPETEIDTLREYLITLSSEIKIEKINSRRPEIYSSFKLSIPETDVDTIMNPDIWPEGVVINQFFQPRRAPRITRN